MLGWRALDEGTPALPALPPLPPLPAWRALAEGWRERLLTQADLDPFTDACAPLDAIARLQARPDLVTHLREMATATLTGSVPERR